MSRSTLPRLHPVTGRALAPVGYRRSGRPIFPILGGSEPPNQPPGNQPPPSAPPAGPPAGQPAPGQPPAAPQQPERPEGVSEAEWAALGDPGKAAIVRERQRAAAAEQALAAERAKHAQKPPAKPETPKPAEPPKGPDGQPDMAALIQQAVAAATAPLLEAQAQRDAETAAGRLRDAVTTAAAARFHDPTDALAHIDLTTLTDGNGHVDQQKVTTALDELLTRKPHLGKVIDTRRHAPDGTPIGGGAPPSAPLDDRVKATLARMQQASGVKFAEA
jgi:hypothetical protein